MSKLDLVPLGELFEITYGVNLELNKLEVVDKHGEDTVNFISRTAKNNGVSAIVKLTAKKIKRGKSVEWVDIEPQPAGAITVAGGGSVLETFLQPAPFYSGRDLFVLYPKNEMSEKQLLFYVTAIRANKYKYSYGRQANKTLKDLLVPSNPPSWFNDIEMLDHKEIVKPLDPIEVNLEPSNWKYFNFDDVFTISKGKRQTKLQLKDSLNSGKPLIPFVAAKADNNAVREYCGLDPLCSEPAITVNYNGSVGEAFYQSNPFYASDDVIILTPKVEENDNKLFNMTTEIGMFLSTVIRVEKYRFNYGRKWNLKRFTKDRIKLPINKFGEIDFEFMEKYISSLPYSSVLK